VTAPAATGSHRTGTSRGLWSWSALPIDGRGAVRLMIALVATIGVFTALGFVLTDLLAPNAITRFDAEVAERLASGRTQTMDDLAHRGAMLSSTPVKIAVTAVFAVAALALWRRWHEPVLLALTLIFEATAFIVVTTIVARPRPDVVRLEDSPVDSSFPSGHVAAATVYGAFVIIVFWHTTSTWRRSVAVVVVASVVAIVTWARLYQGMHFVSDVVTGILLGLWSLTVCLWILRAPEPSDEPRHRDERHVDDRQVDGRVGDGSRTTTIMVDDDRAAALRARHLHSMERGSEVEHLHDQTPRSRQPIAVDESGSLEGGARSRSVRFRHDR
jgi:membrane-associated phospholipid phosphatase